MRKHQKVIRWVWHLYRPCEHIHRRNVHRYDKALMPQIEQFLHQTLKMPQNVADSKSTDLSLEDRAQGCFIFDTETSFFLLSYQVYEIKLMIGKGIWGQQGLKSLFALNIQASSVREVAVCTMRACSQNGKRGRADSRN